MMEHHNHPNHKKMIERIFQLVKTLLHEEGLNG